jgi:hypothetical protein
VWVERGLPRHGPRHHQIRRTGPPAGRPTIDRIQRLPGTHLTEVYHGAQSQSAALAPPAPPPSRAAVRRLRTRLLTGDESRHGCGAPIGASICEPPPSEATTVEVPAEYDGRPVGIPTRRHSHGSC